jgi:hypothetical protein
LGGITKTEVGHIESEARKKLYGLNLYGVKYFST